MQKPYVIYSKIIGSDLNVSISGSLAVHAAELQGAGPRGGVTPAVRAVVGACCGATGSRPRGGDYPRSARGGRRARRSVRNIQRERFARGNSLRVPTLLLSLVSCP